MKGIHRFSIQSKVDIYICTTYQSFKNENNLKSTPREGSFKSHPLKTPSI